VSTAVVCLGDLMVDVLALLPGPLAVGSDTPAPVTSCGGGAAANVAAWCAALGAHASYLGRVGADAFGRQAVDELAASGVDVRVETDAHRPTGTCLVLVDPAGERTMVPSAGANDAPLDVALLPSAADWLYVSGYALLNAGSRPSALAAMAVARDRGWSLAVDPASAAPLAAIGPATFLGWLGRDVLLLANTDEAQVLTGTDDAEAAARALGARVAAAVVKAGADGAVWSDGSAVLAMPAAPATILDTTGAGDAFAAGFLCTAGDVSTRLRAAARVAARVVGQVGARPSGPLDTATMQ
jgi:sugar/nucleoside kinase (ribokinase family)